MSETTDVKVGTGDEVLQGDFVARVATRWFREQATAIQAEVDQANALSPGKKQSQLLSSAQTGTAMLRGAERFLHYLGYQRNPETQVFSKISSPTG